MPLISKAILTVLLIHSVALVPAFGAPLAQESSQEGLEETLANLRSDLPAGVIPLSLSIGANSELLYMGTSRHGVLRSQDGGSTWEDISRGLPEGIGRFYGAFSSLALSPADDSVLLVGTELGELFRSADRGDTWEGAQGLPQPATRRTHVPLVVFASGFPETVYAIISRPVHSHLTTNTLFKSLDAGQSWFAVKKLGDNEEYSELRVEEGEPPILIAVSPNGVLSIEDVFAPPEVDGQNSQINRLEPLLLGDRTQQTFLDQDMGEIAILVADGEMIKTFDLDGTTIQFTPNSSSGYGIESIDFTFDPELGTDLILGDDDSSQQNLGFTFPFYGMDFSDLFVNSNGNLTFGESDLDPIASLEEFVGGSKMKIAPLTLPPKTSPV